MRASLNPKTPYLSARPKQNNDPYQQLLVMEPSKGWNTLISNNLIDDKESPSLQNVKFIEAGEPSKSDGYTQAGNTLTNNPRGMGYYFDQTNNAKYLLTVDGTDLKYLSGSTWTAISGATFSSTGTITFTQAQNNCYIWDGVNGGARLAPGGTLTRPGTLPNCAFSLFWNGIHVAAGATSAVNVTGVASRLYLADVGQFSGSTYTSSDGSIFTTNSGALSTTAGAPGASVFNSSTAIYIDVNPNDGDKITGLAVFQSNLIILKEHSIWQFSLDTSGNPVLQMITQAYGCVSYKSVARVDNDVFFLTRNGVYVLGYEPNYFAVIRTNELTARIHPQIETINPTYFNQATALFNQYVYYLSLPLGGSMVNSATITYDRRYQAWSYVPLYQAESFVTFYDSNNVESVYFTSANTNQVFQITKYVYSANGTAINSFWTSKSYDLGNFNIFKRWVDCTILFRAISGTVNIQFFTDNGTLVNTFSLSNLTTAGIGSYMFGGTTGVGSGTFYFGGNPQTTSSTATASSNNVPYRFRISKKSRTMQVTITNSKLNENFTVIGLAFRYRPYSPFSWPSSLRISGTSNPATNVINVETGDNVIET